MSEPALSDPDVCTELITPALERVGWNIQSQVHEEVSLTAGQVMDRGRLLAFGKAERPDYVLYLNPNLPLAVVEAIRTREDRAIKLAEALAQECLADIGPRLLERI